MARGHWPRESKVGFKLRRPSERYLVLAGCVHDSRAMIWDIVTDVRGAWHRYQYSLAMAGPEERSAYRTEVIFGLRRFAEELEGLLFMLAIEIDRSPHTYTWGAREIVGQLSAYVQTVRPRVIPAAVRGPLVKHLEMRYRRPLELKDDELRVMAVGLWGLWDRIDDALVDFTRWLEVMAKR